MVFSTIPRVPNPSIYDSLNLTFSSTSTESVENSTESSDIVPPADSDSDLDSDLDNSIHLISPNISDLGIPSVDSDSTSSNNSFDA